MKDLGHYKSADPVKGEVGYPAKAVANFNADTNMEDKTKYGPKLIAKFSAYQIVCLTRSCMNEKHGIHFLT